MNSILLLLAGIAALPIAKKLAARAKELLPIARDNIIAFLNSGSYAFERVTGVDIPDDFQHVVEEFIKNAVRLGATFSEQYVCLPEFWNKVLKYILAKNPAQALSLGQQLLAWMKSVDWKTATIALIMRTLPDELKPYVNQVKAIEATNVAQGEVTKSIGTAILANRIPATVVIPTREQLKPLVDGAATALKAAPEAATTLTEKYAAGGMTPELVAEIEKRHAERMKALKAA
ncbi:MAG TPA: hypothetical protein PKM25_05050 [Candidatus Ozemobacteraceae bacterium]|mgnify:CR=1 FL=1|nr:hypothetical protein [Candidatus Ozemobacteraceae bacterium]